MIFYTHESLNDLLSMWKWILFVIVNVWKIRPTTFRMIGLVINYKVISKNWPIVFMHTNWKVIFNRIKFHPFKVFLKREHKCFFNIFEIDPFIWRRPCKGTPKADNFIKLSLSNNESIFFSITLLMKFLTRKIVFWCTIKHIDIVCFFVQEWLKIS